MLFDKFKKERWLIVGLGNPGAKYDKTRHNAGFMALDRLAADLGADVTRSRFNALCGDAVLDGKRVLLMKPLTYMNASGEAISAAMDFYRIPPENVLILVDDICQDPGRMRVRASGSDGGQRGLRSIIQQMGTDAFPRIRFGVGQKPNPQYELADWVLGVLPAEDMKKLSSCFPLVKQAAVHIFSGKLEQAMGLCNGHRPEAEDKA
jgi:PTH1 family peptidyl-tRNA hydrolase